MKGYRIVLLALGLLLLFGVTAAPALACDDCCSCCDPKTPGYWKTHSCDWPVDGLYIGGQWYDKDDIIPMLGQKPGDKTYTLFRALVAAKLNVLMGCCDCSIGGTIADADAWMAAHPVGSGVAAWDCPWQGGGECLYLTLDWWNNT